MQDIEVFTDVTNQRRVTQQQQRTRNMRVLQSGSGRVIVFDAVIEFRSVGTDHDMSQLVGGTWDTPEEQQEYINALKQTGDATFQSISAMAVEINGWEPGGDGSGSSDLDLFIIIGASVGGAALLFLVLIAFVYCRRRGRDKDAKKPTKASNGTAPTPIMPLTSTGERIST